MRRVCYCGAVTTNVPCDKCKGWQRKGRSQANRNHTEKRGGGWQVLSERYRADNPLCFDCNLEGKTSASEEVHHQVPLDVDISLKMNRSNLVALCRSCHRYRHKTGNLTNSQITRHLKKDLKKD